MNSPSTSERRIRPKAVPLALAVVGLCLVVGSGIARLGTHAVPSPGKLVVKQQVLTWRSPVEKVYRSPTIDETQGRFELENVGGQPVHILEVTTSCGCATPKIETTTIAPGRSVIVEVRALPLQVGERTASVTLKTDSRLSPEVGLQLRIIGSRKPPFMTRATGDLSFGANEPDDVRTISAVNIETSSTTPTPPIVKSDVPFLEIGPASLAKEEPYAGADTVFRRYSYEARLAPTVRPGLINGDVLVTDPWDEEHVQRLRVHIEVSPSLKAVPARVLLHADEACQTDALQSRVLLLTRFPASELEVAVEGAEGIPLTLSPVTAVKPGHVAAFTVSLDPTLTRDGELQIRVQGPSTSDHLVIPVSVRVEGR